MLSTQSRKSRPIHGFKNSSGGFTSSSQARSSERGETGPEPASLTADHWVPRFCSFLVPIAQNTERARPKRQVAGESPAGDTIWGRSSLAERSFDMREAERAALSAPTIFEGIAQSAEWMRHMH